MSRRHPLWFASLFLVLINVNFTYPRVAPANVTLRSVDAALTNLVRLDVREKPLLDVITMIRQQIGVRIEIDTIGSAAEGVAPDCPVTISLAQPIRASAALRLILEPLHLDYRVDLDKLVITTEQDVNTSRLRDLAPR